MLERGAGPWRSVLALTGGKEFAGSTVNMGLAGLLPSTAPVAPLYNLRQLHGNFGMRPGRDSAPEAAGCPC